ADMGFLAAFQQKSLPGPLKRTAAAFAPRNAIVLGATGARAAPSAVLSGLSFARSADARAPRYLRAGGRSGLPALRFTLAGAPTGGTFVASFSGAVLTSARFQLTAPYPVRRLPRLPFPARVAELVDALVSGTSG